MSLSADRPERDAEEENETGFENMKLLYCSTVRSHIGQFHVPVINALKAAGHEVHAAYHDNSADKPGLDLSMLDMVFEVPFDRSPYSPQNIKACRILKKIIDEGDYDIIHCHTPVGGVMTRIAARDARKRGTKVFYTAHGFHFYKGAPKKYWAMFYPVEKHLAKDTDVLITINQEDYDLARKHFHAGRIVKVNGVGVDLSKFHVASEEEKQAERAALGIRPEQFVMLYPADLAKGKNHPMIFRAMARLKDDYPNLMLLCPGQTILKEEFKSCCERLGIAEMVQFLGYRRDIPKILAASDCAVSSSRREGLPMNLIEAAASGKYIIATNVRGNADVVRQTGFGTLVELDDDKAMAEEIRNAMKLDQKPDLERIRVFDHREIVKAVMGFYGDIQSRGSES